MWLGVYDGSGGKGDRCHHSGNVAHPGNTYGPGKQPSDVNTSLLFPDPNPAPPDFPPLIDDPDNRVYRGPDSRALFPNVDREEVVHSPTPGSHLVICGVLPHLANDDMYGWVRVLP